MAASARRQRAAQRRRSGRLAPPHDAAGWQSAAPPQRQLREELQALRESLQRERAASAAKTRFFAAASHDLRQPLQALAINASALALLAQRQADARISRLAADIDQALRQTNQLLDSLLDLSQLDAGVLRPVCVALDLRHWLHGVAADFAPLAAQRGLSLQVLPPAGRPAPDAAALQVRTDPDLLRRVLHNLLANALKFTTQGGVTLQPGLAADGRVTVAVVDSGVGIAEAEQARVFEEFHQVRAAAPQAAAGSAPLGRPAGLGLGLAVVRRITRLLAIDLALSSRPGEGTRVVLSWPPTCGGALTSAAAAA